MNCIYLSASSKPLEGMILVEGGGGREGMKRIKGVRNKNAGT